MRRPTLLLILLLAAARLPAVESLRLWGQVRDAAGPVSGALVVAGRDSCRADALGNYAFAGLPAGPLTLRITAPDREALRQNLWLRGEAFLPLVMRRPRPLATGFPEDSLRLLAAFPRGGATDLDQDGRPDALGWRPLREPWQELCAGLPRQDPWGGLWSVGASDEAERPGAQELGFPAFFSLGRAAGEALVDSPAPEGPGLWAGGGEAGATGGLQAACGLGRWHRAWLKTRGARDEAGAPRAGRRRREAALELGHHWLAAPRLQVEQRVLAGSAARRALTTDNPGLWLPAPSLARWEGAALDQRQLSWQGLARWSPGEDLRADALLWTRRRAQDADGREWDRLRNRLLDEGLPDSLEWGWFPTRRAERRHAWGARVALELRHERGLLQGALELERQRRLLDARLDSMAWLPQGRNQWLSLREQATWLSGRLLDRLQATPDLALEACLDLRYSYAELERRQVGLFQLGEVPQVGFSQDLLSLEPRLALRLGRGSRQVEAYVHTRRLPQGSADWWDLGRSPEALWDLPLLVAVGGDRTLKALLPATRLGQAGLWAGLPTLRLGLWTRQWRDLPLPFWTRRSQTLDPDQLTRPLDARQVGMDLRLEGRLGRASGSLQGAWRRAWLEGTLWRPLAGALWEGRPHSLARLPGEPQWAAAGQLSTRGQSRLLRFDPLLRLRWQGPRDAEGAPGLLELPALLELDAELALRLPRRPAWTLTLSAGDLLDRGDAQGARLAWDPVDRVARRVELPGAGRLLELRLAWRPASLELPMESHRP